MNPARSSEKGTRSSGGRTIGAMSSANLTIAGERVLHAPADVRSRSGPKRPQLELDGIEWPRSDNRVSLVLSERFEASREERQHLERLP